MIRTDVDMRYFPEAFADFKAAVGESTWLKVVQKLKAEQRGNAALAQFFEPEFIVPLQLATLSGLHQKLGSGMLEHPGFQGPLLPTVGFVAQVNSLLDAWPADAARKLTRRIAGALKNPADMRGLRLEIAMATHFVQRGWTVEWPEVLERTGETFDLLVMLPTGAELEVECKSIGEDCGRRIPRRAAYDLLRLLLPRISRYFHGFTSGLAAVLTVEDRLPSAYRGQDELAKAIAQQIVRGASGVLAHGVSLRLHDFDSARLKAADFRDDGELRDFLDSATGTQNRTKALVPSRAGGALLLAIQSEREDTLTDHAENVLKDAAKRQLTGRRAGVLVAGYEALGSHDMQRLAQHDAQGLQGATGLRTIASAVLAGASRQHVATVAHVGNVDRDGLGLGAQSGSAYAFNNEMSEFWRPEFAGLFTLA